MSERSLIAHYRMAQVSAAGSVVRILDSSGNANHQDEIYVGGTAPWIVSNRGVDGQGASFPGSALPSASDNPSMTLSGEVSVAAWVYMDESVHGPIVDKESEFILAVDNGQIGAVVESCFVATDVPATTGWHHVAFSYDETMGQVVLYVDGVMEAAVSCVASPNSNGPLKLANNFVGALDEVYVLRRALSDRDVGDLAKLGSASLYLPLDVRLADDRSGFENDGVAYGSPGSAIGIDGHENAPGRDPRSQPRSATNRKSALQAQMEVVRILAQDGESRVRSPWLLS